MFGIFICMVFLFSTLPTIQETDILVNKQESLLKSNDISYPTGFIFIEIAHIIIKYNSEELMDEPWGMCYNITPINARHIGIGIGEGFDFSIERYKITDKPSYISQDISKGFIGNHYVFLYRIIEG